MEINAKPITVKEVLEDVNKSLSGITLRGNCDLKVLIEDVGIPVARAINGIQICLDAINRESQESTEPEFVLEPVKDDNNA